MPVFDQTEGKPLQTFRPANLEAEEAFERSVETLREVALSIPGEVVSTIAVRSREPQDPSGAAGWYVPATRTIVVLSGWTKPCGTIPRR
jgi:hypothetical protein